MNHCVPNFEDDFSISTSSGLSRPKKPPIGQGGIMELLWQNGQVVAQIQKLSKKTQLGDGCEAAIPAEQREIRPDGEGETAQPHLFMQEDEMASWLQYPLDGCSFDRDLYADLLYSAPPPPSTPIATAAPPRPVGEIRPPPGTRVVPQNSQRLQNFLHISRIPTRFGNISGQSMPGLVAAVPAVRESTVVESNETPATGAKSRFSYTEKGVKANILDSNVRSGTALEPHELAAGILSSPSCSGASFSTSVDRRPLPVTAAGDRKRKGREADDSKCQPKDTDNEATECTKQAQISASTKKSRAAEVHNLSERRRRDRINEKMKVLQELIPRCNKSDKASMLDDAIEYLKSLQLQVQMMSMGCGMVPMMYPGLQQYQYMTMMGMGMDMSMNRPMVSYPSLMPGSALSNPAGAARLSPCFPMPAFHLPPVPVPDPSRIQASNPTDSMLNSAVSNVNQPRLSNSNNPRQQFFGLHAQPPFPQNQVSVQPDITKQHSSKEIGNPENHQSG